MKIENKIFFSNIFNIALIILIGLFAMQNLNILLTKLRFVEIADDLNASFLEMRLSEKNYFLYGDNSALEEIKEKIYRTTQTMSIVEPDIVRAIGRENMDELKSNLNKYLDTIDRLDRSRRRDMQSEEMLRERGKRLREFSDSITRLERSRVNILISKSKDILFYSFWAIFASAIIVGHLLSKKIVRSLRKIEELANTISHGNFNKIEGVVLNDELGSVMKAINSMSDELKTREEEIIQSKKLASMGILVAGVSHELTNPLNNISMIAQTYLDVYDKLDRGQRLEFMEKIEGETERIKAIVKNLLDFSKPKEPNLAETDMNGLIQNTLKLVQNMLDISNIETRLNLGSGLPAVFVDSHQIQQVLVNLIINAIQAMSPGGVLTISTRYPAGGVQDVIIEIADTGRGIPPEFLPHIFDPFFSTKEEGGTGLGLWVSYGIIKNHKGTIKVDSKPGAGTVFTVAIPIFKS
ncbi:MAG: ATP-binding protein [Nitrospiraceae bacterium]|nr:ATP-binding protein [Nitrospiraceae bacterium]